MKIETPLHTDHRLDQLAGQFAHWRQTRSHPSERIPQRLWDHAVALARVLPHTRVASHLRLSAHALKQHLAAHHESTAAAPPTPRGCVEVPLAPPGSMVTAGTESELQRADGARLRVPYRDSTPPLATLVRAFLEVA